MHMFVQLEGINRIDMHVCVPVYACIDVDINVCIYNVDMSMDVSNLIENCNIWKQLCKK